MIIKPSVLICLMFLFMGFSGLSQNVKRNDCSKGKEIRFLDPDSASRALDSHGSEDGYLNIIIGESGISYKGDIFNSREELLAAIKQNSSLPSSFGLVVGISEDATFEIFTAFICWLDSDLWVRIGSVEAYHFH